MRRGILILIVVLLSGCLKNEALMLPFKGFAPTPIDDGLNISTPELQQVDDANLESAYKLFYSSEKLPMSKALVVMRNGHLISEAYSKDLDDIERIDNIQSCTKSIVALLVGIAIEEGKIENVYDPIDKYLPEFFNSNNLELRGITIEDCLTMQAGLPYNGNSETERMVNLKGSSLEYILSKSLDAEPGTKFLYSDFPYQLLAGVLQKVTSNKVEQYAFKKIFQPLGIREYQWESTKDGINIGSFSLSLTARSLLKIGQLCIQNGIWNGVRLIPSEWIQDVSRKQALQSNYGYGFYIDSNSGAYQMKGNGGQFVYILPSKQLVIAYTAYPYTSSDLWGSPDELIKSIVTACK